MTGNTVVTCTYSDNLIHIENDIFMLVLGSFSEPITAQAIFNRQGLGTSTSDRDFKGKIRKIVEEYAQSNNTYDLVFSSGFDNDQRKEMHE